MNSVALSLNSRFQREAYCSLGRSARGDETGETLHGGGHPRRPDPEDASKRIPGEVACAN